MKNVLALLITISTLVCVSLNLKAQDKKVAKENTTFKVWGNCEMCKATIQDAARIKGVQKAIWNQKTKMLTITYKPDKVKLEDIHKAIAESGYDTELATAPDAAYADLPDCCHYERPNRKKE
jgi:cation transport ATPase